MHAVHAAAEKVVQHISMAGPQQPCATRGSVDKVCGMLCAVEPCSGFRGQVCAAGVTSACQLPTAAPCQQRVDTYGMALWGYELCTVVGR